MEAISQTCCHYPQYALSVLYQYAVISLQPTIGKLQLQLNSTSASWMQSYRA